MKTQIERTLLDINTEKIKSEKEAAQLREQLAKKTSEMELVTKELLKLRKRNEALEKMVNDLQVKIKQKDNDCVTFDSTM